MDDLLHALELPRAAVVGDSLGGMLALWYAAARTERIASLVLIGEPAVALPGVAVRMPLSLLTVPSAVLREVPGGHAPWLEAPEACAALVVRHLASTGSTPARVPSGHVGRVV